VLIVGVLSLVAPQLFAHPSVWSHFGSGYLFIPLVLPVLGLIWLRRVDRAADGGPAGGGSRGGRTEGAATAGIEESA
jgi:hypothetical protein